MVKIRLKVLWLTRENCDGEANGEMMGETDMIPQSVLGELAVRNTGIYNFREGVVHIHCVLFHTRSRMLSAYY
jgi:hypothetical protein